MKLCWLNPTQLDEADFALLCKGGVPGGWKPLQVAEKLLSGAWLAFRCDGGAFAVEKAGDRLYVTCLCIERFGWRLRAFRDVMDRLAADLGCNTVETTVFDERLAQAMVRIRARPESWNMVWQVEGRQQHGHED